MAGGRYGADETVLCDAVSCARALGRRAGPAYTPKHSKRSRSRSASAARPALYYLPLTIAERLGHFKEQGLDVTINDFRGGAQSLQALAGGSVDVVTGAYEHTIRMQAKGQDVRALIELGRFPGIVLGIRKERASAYKSPADLKGMKIGVSAPGSSTNFFVMYLLAKAGLKPTDASYIGVGIGPSVIAAVIKGEIDAMSNLEPMMTKLELDGQIKVVADTRTEEGTRAIFGGSNPAAVLYAKQDFIARNPNTVQALVNAFYKTLKWLESATPEQVTATVPEEYWLGDRGALHGCGQGQQAGLFGDRCHPSRRDEVGERHAGVVRR